MDIKTLLNNLNGKKYPVLCADDYIHGSETAVMFTQFLSSLLERDSTNEWPP